MKFIQMKDALTGLPLYINADSVNAVYADADMRCTAVDIQGGVMFVKEKAETIMNTLYQANYEPGFLFSVQEAKDGDD